MRDVILKPHHREQDENDGNNENERERVDSANSTRSRTDEYLSRSVNIASGWIG